ncbi:phosphoserine transaminase [Cryptococcus amylolentus CBS 6039]|uniref:phosphoserine transaminase n=2 Tax=Cryptococcus amylolentus TaxID=104669 RepID=A0A1E3HL70_9TREE|nr:phosphoserine transaminase [Cryptococcus amylolentus CBS 6039]ODN77079.1 phosphoserine transaminase [Cryptococcus amylolentus CBS 6039]ODO04933.1 phosphoserine transaminase [Cryptococcus amylolentus CBS 6273]
MPDRKDVHNFAAGPSPLPSNVLEEASQGLLNYADTGMGICELSHRGKEFKAVIEGAEADLRKLLQIPDNYAVLFSQGGGTGQFSAVLLNLLSAHRIANPVPAEQFTPPTVDYVLTGSWSSKAYAEAQRLTSAPFPNCPAFATPRVAATTKPTGWTRLPKKEEYNFSKDAAYVYYCENETINGIEYPPASNQSSEFAFPFEHVPEGVNIVADYSSSFISRPIPNIEKHAIIYAGAQKNLGPSGVTVLIVRKDLLVDTAEAAKLGCVPVTPITYEYKILADNASLYNTPPTFPIYVSALVLQRLISEKGGLEGLEKVNKEKAELLYATLDKAEEKGAIKTVVREKEARSWMNVTFNIVGEGKEKAFLDGAAERGFQQLKGHRSVGGVRASIYNAVTLESVQLLCQYIEEFTSKQQ